MSRPLCDDSIVVQAIDLHLAKPQNLQQNFIGMLPKLWGRSNR